jgi:hypothetical protein
MLPRHKESALFGAGKSKPEAWWKGIGNFNLFCNTSLYFDNYRPMSK